MHALFEFVSILSDLLGGALILYLLPSIQNWAHRRMAHLFILLQPIGIVGLGLSGLHHVIGQLCPMGMPLWDVLLGVLLPLGLTMIALGAIILGLSRLVVMRYSMSRQGMFVDPEVHAYAQGIAQRMKMETPSVWLCLHNRPLAFTWGLRKPAIILSTWMLEYLDQREIEAVLAHELEHIARHDYAFVLLATVLRDAFFYLPTSWIAYRHIQQEKEIMCDDGAVTVTQRPLALASALTKVWIYAVEAPHMMAFGKGQPFAGRGISIQKRIERLLSSHDSTLSSSSIQEHIAPQYMLIRVLFSVLVLSSVTMFFLLIVLGCNPFINLPPIL